MSSSAVVPVSPSSANDRKDDAVQLLRATSWFHDATEPFVDAIASIMVPIVAEDGYILVEEGSQVSHFLILERGTLVRTKLCAEDDTHLAFFNQSLRGLDRSLVKEELDKSSVVVDTLTHRGRITGLLQLLEMGGEHPENCYEPAYATLTARGSDTKVWLVSAQDFRDMLDSSKSFAWEMLASMSRELRSGSKSIRSLMRQVKHSDTNLNLVKLGSASKPSLKIRVLCYDATSWVTESFKPAVDALNEQEKNESNGNSNGSGNGDNHLEIEMDFTTERLGKQSATHAAGYEAICTFVNDVADADTIKTLSLMGVRMIAQRAAGFDRIDCKAAKAYGMTVARVPAYSPYAVAEMAVCLLMAVNRKIYQASSRVRMANFTLDTGLLGIDIYGKTVGVMGTGKIGQVLCSIIAGFGAKLICFDVYESDEVKKLGGTYVKTKEEIFARSDVLFLMMPLLPDTKHTINDGMLHQLKPGVILINTSRGALIDTKALLKGLQEGIISGAGMDVYENEADYFFQDWSARRIQDVDLKALLGEQNIVLTAHQAFFTKEAVDKIVETTLENLRDYKKNGLVGTKHPNNCIPTHSSGYKSDASIPPSLIFSPMTPVVSHAGQRKSLEFPSSTFPST